MAIAVETFGSFEGKRVDQFTLKSDDRRRGRHHQLGRRGARLARAGGGRQALGGARLRQFRRLSQPLAAFRLARRPRRQPHRRRELRARRQDLQAARQRAARHTLHGGPEGLGRHGLGRPSPTTPTTRCASPITRPTAPWAFPATSSSPRPTRLERQHAAARTRRHAPTGDADQPGAAPVLQPRHHRRRARPPLSSSTASAFTETDEDLIPTGAILPVERARSTISASRAHAARRGRQADRLRRQPRARPAAATSTTRSRSCSRPTATLTLKLWTDRPGLQFYNGVYTDIPVPGLSGKSYGNALGLLPRGPGVPRRRAPPAFPHRSSTARQALQPLVRDRDRLMAVYVLPAAGDRARRRTRR